MSLYLMQVAPHVQMLYWNVMSPLLNAEAIGSTPHVQMLYWNLADLSYDTTDAELHMYKCCIEIFCNKLIKPEPKKLHMYKCCIEMCVHVQNHHCWYAPHVQMLYWNRFTEATLLKAMGSTCTNVVLKYVIFGNDNIFKISSTCTNVVLKCRIFHKSSGTISCSTCTNVVLKFEG